MYKGRVSFRERIFNNYRGIVFFLILLGITFSPKIYEVLASYLIDKKNLSNPIAKFLNYPEIKKILVIGWLIFIIVFIYLVKNYKKHKIESRIRRVIIKNDNFCKYSKDVSASASSGSSINSSYSNSNVLTKDRIVDSIGLKYEYCKQNSKLIMIYDPKDENRNSQVKADYGYEYIYEVFKDEFGEGLVMENKNNILEMQVVI